MNYFPLIMLGVLLNAGAQLLLKEGMRRIGYFEFAWANAVPISLQVAANPFVLAGLFAYVVSVATGYRTGHAISGDQHMCSGLSRC